MANRRMFSREVCDSDLFIEMPFAAQALYLHLNLNADDDGCVARANQVVQCINATPNDFKVLLENGYVLQLEHKLYVITDWLNNNQIRSDRKVRSIYMNELAQVRVDENRRYSLTNGTPLLEYIEQKRQEAEAAKEARLRKKEMKMKEAEKNNKKDSTE